MESGAAVDDHALDQLVVHMALADGRGGRRSRVVARSPVSSHAKTAMAICERACGATFYAREGEEGGVGEGLVAIECVGIGAEPRKE
jgi:RNA 3'-terminal phosphate cyclase